MTTFYGYVDYTSTGAAFYVGKGTHRRIRENTRRNKKHQRVAKVYGCRRVIEFASSVETCVLDWEITTIAELHTFGSRMGCNLTRGGEGASGSVCSEETRRKLSESHKGQRKGVPLSPAHCAKISEAKRRQSAETIAKIRASLTGRRLSTGMLGKTHSVESRERMSVAQRTRFLRDGPLIGEARARKVAACRASQTRIWAERRAQKAKVP
jgi:NUMOD3 motif